MDYEHSELGTGLRRTQHYVWGTTPRITESVCMMRRTFLTSALDMPEIMSYIFVFCRKKNAVYRQKCTPIWPSKSKHSKSEAIFMFCVVIDLCKKLYLFRTVTFKHGIVYNKNIGTVFRIQWKNSVVYDSGCKDCSKTHPVNLNHLLETIHGIFCKIRCIGTF